MKTITNNVNLLVLLCILQLLNPLNACTIFMTEKDGKVLVGNNEDYSFPFTSVWFIPATETEFGRICFGFAFNENDLAATGGMNDQGLFIDGNSVESIEWSPEEGKESHKGIVEAYVLAHFANVEEALNWFKNVNVPILKRAKFLLADKSGSSAVVEWAKGELQIIRREGHYQISTNFRQSDFEQSNYPDYRYNLAKDILDESDEYSVDMIRRILSVTHFEESRSKTLFSNIYDLKNGIVYIYNFHSFEESVVFNLNDELKKGKKDYFIPGLFSAIPYSQHLFVPNELSRILSQSYARKGLDGTIEDLKEVKRLCLSAFDRDYTPGIANSLGYDLLEKNQIDDAIEVFKLNIKEHPDYENGYDSLGEAYMTRGDTELAIEAYEKALEFDPSMQSAINALNKLKEK